MKSTSALIGVIIISFWRIVVGIGVVVVIILFFVILRRTGRLLHGSRLLVHLLVVSAFVKTAVVSVLVKISLSLSVDLSFSGIPFSSISFS